MTLSELYQIKGGWIEEIQEKEFTKDDMISFGKYCRGFSTNYFGTETFKVHLNDWINENK